MHRFEIENWGIVESINNPFIDFFFKKTNKIDKTLEINKKHEFSNGEILEYRCRIESYTIL